MNPLFNMLNGSTQGATNPIVNLIQQFNQFRNSFRGDPRQQVQQLLNSGKVSREQYNEAVQMANQLQRMMMK